MTLFTAEIRHSEKTYRRLCQIQYWRYRKDYEIKVFLAGTVIVLLSLFIRQATLSIMVLFIGCWFVAGSQTPPLRLAKKMIDGVNGNFPQTAYAFYPDSFVIKNQFGERRDEYSAIEDLVEDGNTIILFKKDRSGYVIDSSTIQSGKQEFIDFLEEKTGKTILQSRDLCTANYLLSSIKSALSASAGPDHPRL